MQANYVQRFRLTFSKVGPTRYIGHLDLARTIERSLNRAHIPLAYTQGYNPRPRMQLASALPLGFTSEGELADIWLLEKVDPDLMLQKLKDKLAPGIVIHKVEEIDLRAPALQNMTEAAAYIVSFSESINRTELTERVTALLNEPVIMRARHSKQYDLKSLIHSLSVGEDESGDPALSMELSLLPGRTGRPDEVLQALGLDPLDTHIHRTELFLANEPVSQA